MADFTKWPRECFLAVKLKVDQVDGAATTAGNHRPLRTINGCTPYLSKSPVSTLFTTAKCIVNDKLISNMNELSATNTLFRTIYGTESMQRTIESSTLLFLNLWLRLELYKLVVIKVYSIPFKRIL